MTTPTPAKLRDIQLAGMRERDLLAGNGPISVPAIDRRSLLGHIDALTAENARLTAELAAAQAQIDDFAAQRREIRSYVEGNGFEWQDQCSTAFNATTAIGWLAGALGTAKEQLAAANAKLAALAAPVTDRVALVLGCYDTWCKCYGNMGTRSRFSELPDNIQRAWSLAVEHAYAAGRASLAADLAAKNAEIADLKQRLLTAAGDDLCRLTQEEIKDLTSGKVPIPPKAEFMASCERFHDQIAGENGISKGCLTIAQLIAENERLKQQLAALAEPKDEDGLVLLALNALNEVYVGGIWSEYFHRAFRFAVEKVAAHVRAESSQQIADQARRIDTLDAQVETAEAALDKLAAAKGDKLTVAGESIAMGDELVDGVLAAHDRLAAELATAQQAIAAKTAELATIYLLCFGERAVGDEESSMGLAICNSIKRTNAELARARKEREVCAKTADYWSDRYKKDVQHAIDAELATAKEQFAKSQVAFSSDNPCSKIFDHKWLDPQCVESGCQSLFLHESQQALVETTSELQRLRMACEPFKKFGEKLSPELFGDMECRMRIDGCPMPSVDNWRVLVNALSTPALSPDHSGDSDKKVEANDDGIPWETVTPREAVELVVAKKKARKG